MNYFIGLIDGMTLDELEVWRLLCKYSDFETRETGYTINQIVTACDKRLGLTTQKVRTILKKFIDRGFVGNVVAGTKGKETRAKLLLNDMLFNENKSTIIQQQSNNNLTNKNEVLQQFEGEANNNLTTNQQQSNNTIKEKEKENNKYSDEFNELWSLYPRKVGKPKAFSTYKKLIKKYEYEQIKEAIECYIREIEVYKTDERFIRHGSTFFNCIEDDYIITKKKAPTGIDAKKKNNYSDSICNNRDKYTRGVEILR